MKQSPFLLILLSIIASASACSPVLEATRPTPTDVSQLETGESRDSILEQLGQPLSRNTAPDGASCDLYQLYTRGYGTAGKVPIVLAEAAADVFTLGLAEAVLTPTEGVTRNEKHPVTFCYHDGKLLRIQR